MVIVQVKVCNITKNIIVDSIKAILSSNSVKKNSISINIGLVVYIYVHNDFIHIYA